MLPRPSPAPHTPPKTEERSSRGYAVAGVSAELTAYLSAELTAELIGTHSPELLTMRELRSTDEAMQRQDDSCQKQASEYPNDGGHNIGDKPVSD